MIQKFQNFINSNFKLKHIIFLFLIFVFFFSFSMIITVDSAHYMSMTNIFEGISGWETWDIVRGFTFPYLIFLSNSLFGRTTQGVLIFSFIFYLIMIYFVNKITKRVFNDNTKLDKIFRYFTFFIIIFNPIIFGYYHALLTEFVAITISIIFCYVCWKWMDIDDIKDKKNIFYIILFVIFTIFAWFLKQPYVTIVLFPLIISSFLSIISKFKWKNILLRLGTICICLICMFVSIKCWNNFLAGKSIDTNTGRSSGNMFGGQLIYAVDYLVHEKDEMAYTDKKINDSEYLSDNEKKKLLKEPDNYYIYSIKNFDGVILEQDIVKKSSMKSSLNFITNNFFEHPTLYLKSYVDNYLLISNFYSKDIKKNMTFPLKRDINLNYVDENSTIAGRMYRNVENIFYMSESYYDNVKDLEQFQNIPRFQQQIMSDLCDPYHNIFKFSMLFLPFVLIFSFVLRFFIKDKKNINLCIILLGYSFFHVLAHAITGAAIDRYASPAFLTTLIGYNVLIYCIIKNRGVKNEKTKK